MTFDVVVIGAGPAGLSAASALGARGVSTLICESSRLPVDKACGEGIMPSGLADLERLGVPLSELRARGQPFAGVRYIAESGLTAEADFAEGAGIGLRRVELSELLLARVRQLPHVAVMQGVRARLRHERAENGRPARLAVQIEGSLFEPRLIIGADGLNSRVRRHAHIAFKTVPPLRWGVRRHFQIEPWTDHVEVYWSRGVEAYVTPIAADQTNVAFLFDRQSFDGGTQGELFQRLMAHFPELSQRLVGARGLGNPRASGPLHQWPARPLTRGLVLLGDAAGYVDALTGEGVGAALRQALLLADVVVPLLRQSSDSPLAAGELVKFVRAERRASRGARLLTKTLLWLKGHPRLLEHTIQRLAADQQLFRRCLSANQGTAPLLGPHKRSPADRRSWHALRHSS